MSTAGRTAITVASGAVFLVVRFFCLNYTKAFGVEHHFEWAREHGMPEPSYLIFLIGVVQLAAGGALLGRVSKSWRM